MNQMDWAEILRSSVLGTELDEREASILAEHMGLVRLTNGELLVSEDEQRRTLFLLAEGRLCVCKTVGGVEESLYRMRPGECAGTRAFVDGSARKAALRSEDDSSALTLEPDDFEALVESHPRLVYKVMRAIFRITHTNLMRVNLERNELANYMHKTGGRY
ncbi:cyclic nucleotide-binding domain-containing protein [Thiocapsa sp.]|uniref:Crp/Fnr family transcriptional regulator n=1 Tax=Thiocapsa sp. TaxID=2024551 RepID=UPI002C4D36B4|nr:cyclic nucleotide-binding domain-containing protein [Thiocapsa sp.]HSO82094.1 cyclic nucleotide-binding domain-containing protein [Thiocapsa sp.]